MKESCKVAAEQIESARVLAHTLAKRMNREEERLRRGEDPTAPQGGGGPFSPFDPFGCGL